MRSVERPIRESFNETNDDNNSLIEMEEELEREKQEIREKVDAKYPPSRVSETASALYRLKAGPGSN
jgi:predicted nuclease with TOPRIM domain